MLHTGEAKATASGMARQIWENGFLAATPNARRVRIDDFNAAKSIRPSRLAGPLCTYALLSVAIGRDRVNGHFGRALFLDDRRLRGRDTLKPAFAPIRINGPRTQPTANAAVA